MKGEIKMSENDYGTLTGRKRRAGGVFLRYALWYTLLFAVVGTAVFLPFRHAGKSFVWGSDGLPQTFARLLYLNENFQKGVQALFSGEGWQFPLYNFNSGIVALDTQYGFPQFLAAFWPEGEIDSFYTFYVLLSYYLAGLSFLYFAAYFCRKLLPSLSGAVSYVFCAFALFAGVRHPHFIMPMIMLPLIVTGAEKVMRRERGWLLLAAVFLSVIAHFGVYFSCMMAILTVCYVCVRFFDLYGEDRLQAFARMTGRLAAWAGTGALLGCFTAVPTLLEILGGSRVGEDIWGYTNPLFYQKSYYRDFLTDLFVLPNGIGAWMRAGFSALCLPALVLMFIRRDKKTRTLRILFLLVTVMHLVPAVAYVMSGFSNTSNRFCFGYAFCAAAVLMFMLPEFENITWQETMKIWIALAGYIALCLLLRLNAALPKAALCAAALLAAWAAVVACRFWFRERAKGLLPAMCLLVTCVSVCCSAFILYDERAGNYVSEFVNDAYERIGSGQYASLDQSEVVEQDDGFFRVSGSASLGFEPNYAFHYGLNALTAYPYYGQSDLYMAWRNEMELPYNALVHRMTTFLRQPSILTLTGVKYYASRDGDEADWPYGFHKVDEIANGNRTDFILENENWLPLGYTYDQYISREEYDAMDALQRREALMQAAVLDTAPLTADVDAAKDLMFETRQVPCQIVSAENITWEDGVLKVDKANSTMTLSFAGTPETETYLRVVGLDLTNGASTRRWTLTVTTDQTSAAGNWYADAYPYAPQQHTQLLDLGYSEEGMTSVTLTFPQKGTFKLEDLQIWCQPMEGFAAQAAALRAESLENIETGWRSLTGTVSVGEDKILCVTLPWLDGWTAYVDGEETPLLHVNSAFMGLELPAGEHTVELRYWLPGLTAGLALTGLGLVCLAGLAVFGRRKKQDG